MADYLKLKTEPVELFYISLTGNGKLNTFNGNYEYLTGVRILKDSPVVKEVKKYWKENQTKKTSELTIFKKEYVRDESGNDTEEETDYFTFYVKSNVELPDGRKKNIDFYDSKGKKVVDSNKLNLGNGTIAKLSLVFKYYSKGRELVSCFLNAVQILKLVERSTGFEAFDDGSIDSEDMFDDNAFEDNEFEAS